MEVNDDSVVLKGGKGPWADSQPENGSNERILVEDCVYGFCHGCLTCGSESVHNRNIIMRRIQIKGAARLSYAEHITMKDCDCVCDTFFDVMPDESQYLLSDFTLQDLRIRARVDNFSEDKLRSVVYENVQVEESTEPAESWHEVKGFQ